MAKKKTKKEIKDLKRKAKEATAANLALEKRVRKLKQKLAVRKQQIGDLRHSLRLTTQIPEVKTSSAMESADLDAASRRAAWKQHRYLRDRYEFHLDAGVPKKKARQMANADLRQEFGADRGYTEEELDAILS